MLTSPSPTLVAVALAAVLSMAAPATPAGAAGTPGVTVSPTPLVVTEGGPSSPLQVVLEAAPAADVAFGLVVQAGPCTVSGPVVFTPVDWDVPRAVEISLPDDDLALPASCAVFGFTQSADPDYDRRFVDVPVEPVADGDVEALDDTWVLDEDDPGAEIDVLANDRNATEVAAGSWTQGAHGTVTCAGRTCTYAPDHDFVGPDSFTYTAGNAADSATATVSVTVQDMPEPVDMEPVRVHVGGGATSTMDLLAWARYPGFDVQFAGVTQPAHGTATCTPEGLCTYVPATGYRGPDSFTFTLRLVPVGPDRAGRVDTVQGTVELVVEGEAAPTTGPVDVPTTAPAVVPTTGPGSTAPAAPAGAPVTTRAEAGGEELARTGGSQGSLAAAAFVMIVAGVTLLRVSRRGVRPR